MLDGDRDREEGESLQSGAQDRPPRVASPGTRPSPTQQPREGPDENARNHGSGTQRLGQNGRNWPPPTQQPREGPDENG
jgi:hypothetical protein